MNKCVKCGSYAFNLYKEDIDQGDLCDVHYWQDRAQKAEAKQEQGEPVAWLFQDRTWTNIKAMADDHPPTVPVYTTPQQRKPLTDEQIKRIWEFLPFCNGAWETFARRIEAAHGIKE